MTAGPKLATYDDLLRLPEDVRAEVIGGGLSVLPSPRPRHAKVLARCAASSVALRR